MRKSELKFCYQEERLSYKLRCYTTISGEKQLLCAFGIANQPLTNLLARHSAFAPVHTLSRRSIASCFQAQGDIWFLVYLEFILDCSTRYLALSALRSLVSYRFELHFYARPCIIFYIFRPADGGALLSHAVNFKITESFSIVIQ